ncbi:MAG: GNAT family N-acetyltransferase [Alcanivorax sediminis]|uniref:GNAT family N-acetyltransferase n=1 Tax=Alcanivorax sediminis TaxID=2663008 RepID=A0A6N7LZ46_9GAMM|nr:GNAT family N-acetyltransferase [Alcanivorax sediminis]MQX53531.1 GNAT family N-acetyltransferase [Alcanivorax sediminis]
MATQFHPETEHLAGMLSRAFYQDPLFVYFFPNDAKRERQSLHTFRFMLRHAHLNGKVVCSSNNRDGAALWLPSDAMQHSWLDLMRLGLLPAFFAQGPMAVQRQLDAVEDMQAMHNTIISEPHYYLTVFGVEPDKQGKGVGSSILRPTLEQFDHEGMPAYLDTHNPENVSLYLRFGFEIAHHGYLPGGAVMHWGMLRKPR